MATRWGRDFGEESQKSFGVSVARDRFSELINLAHKGHQIVVTGRGVEVAEMIPIEKRPPKTKESIREAIEELSKFRIEYRSGLRGLSIKKMISQGRS